MNISLLCSRLIAACMAVLLALPSAAQAGVWRQPSPLPQAGSAGGSQESSINPATQDAQPVQQQAAASQQPSGVSTPVGTAAAPVEKPTGVAASRPAGAAIAPAKQKRARAILIRLGIVVGAAVAVGTVVALSHGSPARPN